MHHAFFLPPPKKKKGEPPVVFPLLLSYFVIANAQLLVRLLKKKTSRDELDKYFFKIISTLFFFTEGVVSYGKRNLINIGKKGEPTIVICNNVWKN